MIKHHHFIGRFEVTNPPLGSRRDYLVDWMAKLIEGQGMSILSARRLRRKDRQPWAHWRCDHRDLPRRRPHLGRELTGTGAARFLHLRHAR